MFIPTSILIVVAICLFIYSYQDYSRRFDEAEREAARAIAEADALDAEQRRDIQDLIEQKATPEQRQEIKILQDQGWVVSEWNAEPRFWMFKKGERRLSAIIGPHEICKYIDDALEEKRSL